MNIQFPREKNVRTIFRISVESVSTMPVHVCILHPCKTKTVSTQRIYLVLYEVKNV
jgi:hypothetical protein